MNEEQKEELETLAAIYADKLCTLSSSSSSRSSSDSKDCPRFEIKVFPADESHNTDSQHITVRFTLPAEYPSECPPICEVTSSMGAMISSDLQTELNEHISSLFMPDIPLIFSVMDYIENDWSPKVFAELAKKHCSRVHSGHRTTDSMTTAMISAAAVSVQSDSHHRSSAKGTGASGMDFMIIENDKHDLEAHPSSSSIPLSGIMIVSDDHKYQGKCPEIIESEVWVDRKSRFQAFFARITHTLQAEMVMDTLMLRKRIRTATHNMFAYRISPRKDPMNYHPNSVNERREDDGEKGAGDKMMFVLRSLRALDVIVVVSRIYGGVHLGPDRFKIIAQMTRNVCEQAEHSLGIDLTVPAQE